MVDDDERGALPVGDEGETFAELLAAAIEQKGWSQAETAREVTRHLPEGEHFSPVNLHHYLQGRSLPRAKYREALAKALDLDAPPRIVRARRRRRASPAAEEPNPTIRLQDMQDGQARLQLDQVVPWTVALRVLEILQQEVGAVAEADPDRAGEPITRARRGGTAGD
ncbi:MAG TPA: helix-turn-helix transcriptional regulator [Microvirga sp.]|jgi:transcriptional regulator with XRE-family HTH domain